MTITSSKPLHRSAKPKSARRSSRLNRSRNWLVAMGSERVRLLTDCGVATN
ncbi:MAG: hypothetical protein AAGA36_11375 [Pseudomonadota bacterium]